MFCKLFPALAIILLCNTIFAQERAATVDGGLRIEDYSVSIGSEKYVDSRFGSPRLSWVGNDSDKNGYVYMEHMEQYSIRLASSFYGASDAKIEIDGKEIGTFRVEANDAIIIERSPKEQGKLTFIMNDTREFYQARLNLVSAQNRGLVKVTFYPDSVRIRYERNTDSNYPHPKNPEDLGYGKPTAQKSGGTGLTGESDQRFRSVQPIQRDYNNAVTINLRLIAEDRRREVPQQHENIHRPYEPTRYDRSKENDVPRAIER